MKYTAQGRRKVLKSGGARYIAASLRANFKVIFVSFSQKTGGARAPPAPPVPPATFSIKFHTFHHYLNYVKISNEYLINKYLLIGVSDDGCRISFSIIFDKNIFFPQYLVLILDFDFFIDRTQRTVLAHQPKRTGGHT